MQKRNKIIVAVCVLAVIFSALYLCGVFYLYKIDLNQYKEQVFNQIENDTGLKVSCENISLKKSFLPKLSVNMYHTLVLYPDESEFIKIRQMDLNVKVLPLLMKKIVIEDAKLTRPIVSVSLYKDFSTSFDKYNIKLKSDKEESLIFEKILRDVLCENYKLKIYDETLSETFILEGEKFILKGYKPNENLHFLLNGGLSSNNKEYLKYDLDVEMPFKEDNFKFTFSPFKPIKESEIKGSVYGHFKMLPDKKYNGTLKINDISLKADNTLLDNNNAEIEFKGEEVQINALLHTSKTDELNVTGNFSFGKRKFIKLNTKAKNIKLENLYKIISVITDSLNIKNEYRDVAVKGLIDADFNISSDFKKLTSTGNMKVINADISHKTLPYAMKNINADINLNNNNVKINKASANINSTPVNITGEINEDVSYKINAYSNNLNLITLIKLFSLEDKIPVKIEQGIMGFNSLIEGILNKSYKLNIKIDLNNLIIKHKDTDALIKIKTALMNVKSDEKNYQGDVLCSGVSAIIHNQNIDAEKFKINFDDKKIMIPENEINNPLNIKLSGEINNYNNTQKMSGFIDLNGDADSVKLAQNIDKVIKLPHKAKGTIKTVGKIVINPESLLLKLRMKADKNNYISYVVINELLNKNSVLNVDLKADKNSVLINDISIFEDSVNAVNSINSNTDKIKKIIKISGITENFKKLKFKDLNIIIPDSITFMSDFIGGEEVSLNGNIKINNTIESPEITGNVKLIKYNIKKYLTSIKNADIQFEKGNMKIIAPDVTVQDSKFNLITDIVPDLKSKHITVSDMKLSSLNLDLNTFFPMLERERNPFSDRLISVKKGYVLINNFQILDLKAKDVVSDIQIENNTVKLTDIRGKSYMGEVEGKMNYDISHGMLEINMTGKGLNIKDSLYDLCKISDNLEGTADIEANINLVTGANEKNVIKSLTGEVNYTAYNGRMGTLGKFEHYLYARNLMYHGLLNATLNRIADAIVRDNTAHYRKSTGTLKFKNGYMYTDNIKTEGENMSIFASGRHNLLTNEANIVIYGRISDEIKNKLGNFGDISLSEIVNSKPGAKSVNVLKIPSDIMKKIPDLYNQKEKKTNTFTVKIFGDINSISAVNSFMWTTQDEEDREIPANDNPQNEQENSLPDFNDMLQKI